MAGFGSMMPGMGGMPMGGGAPQLQPMQIPPMAADDNAATGMKILQAALQRQSGQQGSVSAPGAPAFGGGPAPMSLAPPAPGAGMGMLSSLLGKMAAMGAPLQNQGGMGPAPSALTGLW